MGEGYKRRVCAKGARRILSISNPHFICNTKSSLVPVSAFEVLANIMILFMKKLELKYNNEQYNFIGQWKLV